MRVNISPRVLRLAKDRVQSGQRGPRRSKADGWRFVDEAWGVRGIGDPAYGFYRLHLRAGRRWFIVEHLVMRSRKPPTAGLVGGPVLELLSSPIRRHRHLHAAIEEVLSSLERTGCAELTPGSSGRQKNAGD